MRSPAATSTWWRVPQGEGRRVLVWRVGGALLAAPIDAVVEVAPAEGGSTDCRAGRLDLRGMPGLQTDGDAPHAVILRADSGLFAIAADEVEGVRTSTAREESPTPDWLHTLPTEHLAGLLQLPDARVAALLDVESLAG